MSISTVQTMLKAHGFDPGPIDGVWGSKTENALRQALAGYAEVPLDGDVDPELIAQLKIDEGCRLTAYKDTVGVWTVGYGHAHVAPGTVWTQAQAEAQLVKDVREHNAKLLAALPWITSLTPARQRVLYNMAYNLGVQGLLGFKNTLAMVKAGDYAGAANGMLGSLWAKQVKGRAVRLANEMRSGQAS